MEEKCNEKKRERTWNVTENGEDWIIESLGEREKEKKRATERERERERGGERKRECVCLLRFFVVCCMCGLYTYDP